MELDVYLKEQYKDYIMTCKRCSKIVLTVSSLYRDRTRAQADDCRESNAKQKAVSYFAIVRAEKTGAETIGDAHIHESCLAAYQRRGVNECPACKTSFVTHEPSPLGEKAASRETDHLRRGPSKRRRGAGAQNGAEDDEDEDDESEDELEEEEGMLSQSQNQTQSQQIRTQPEASSQRPRQNSRPARNGVSYLCYPLCKSMGLS